MITFTFKQSSCVAVGTFNIYIVQPKLLVDMGVFETDKPVLLSGDLTRPGYQFETNNSKWVVRPDRLSVESKDPTVDCGGFVERTLAALCWTPIMAVGINAVFEASLDCETRLPDAVRLPTYSGATQRTVHLSLADGNSKTNLQLTASEEQLTLSVNRHTEFGDVRDDHKQLTKAVQSICGSFMEHRTESIDIAKEAFSGEFIYERNNMQSGCPDN